MTEDGPASQPTIEDDSPLADERIDHLEDHLERHRWPWWRHLGRATLERARVVSVGTTGER